MSSGLSAQRLAGALAGLLLVLLPDPLGAQAARALQVDERVRVFAPAVSGSVLVGELIGVSPDTLVVRPQGTALALRIPVSTVRRLEVASSRRRERNARIGAVVGGAAGVAAVATGFGRDCAECGTLDAVVMAVPLGLIGAGLGGILGVITAGEEWDIVPLAPPARTDAGWQDGSGL